MERPSGSVARRGRRVAYLVNQYPKPTHSFIRREIAGLEAAGVQVVRYSIRASLDPLVDEFDRAEAQRTRVILRGGLGGLASSALAIAATRPLRCLRALAIAWQLARRSKRGLAAHLVYLAEACALVRDLARSEVNHLHAHFATNPATVALLCRALGGPPYSFTMHGPEISEFPCFSTLRTKVAHAAFVVAISEHGRSQFYRHCPLEHWPKIHLVHCGLGADFLAHPSTPIPAAPRLVCVARLDAEKGHLVLLEAAALLAREKIEFELVFTGDGPARPEIERSIHRLGLERQVHLVGWQSSNSIRAEILGARAVVLASFDEGLPVVLMEALALERPVISTFVAGIPELIESGIGGTLVPAGSVDALARALRTVLCESPEVLQTIGRLGRERVLRDHNAASEAARLAALFGKELPVAA